MLVNKQVVSAVTTAAKTRRTQEERRSTAERRIIRAAIKIISRKGLAGLTLAAAGEEAGYSRGIAGHHFGKKDDLLVALVRHITDQFRQMLADTATSGPGLPKLIALVNAYLAAVEQHSDNVRALHLILTEGVNSPALAPALAAASEVSIRGIEKPIRDGIAAGEIRADVDPYAQAVLILAGLRGVLAQKLVDPGIDLQRIRKEFVDSLARSLKV